MDEQAKIHVYDPKVKRPRMMDDLNYLNTRTPQENDQLLKFEKDPYEAAKGAHAIAIITEWDEFKTFDWPKIYKQMKKPAFVFDGRNILDHEELRKIGFEVWAVGKNKE